MKGPLTLLLVLALVVLNVNDCLADENKTSGEAIANLFLEVATACLLSVRDDFADYKEVSACRRIKAISNDIWMNYGIKEDKEWTKDAALAEQKALKTAWMARALSNAYHPETAEVRIF